MDNELIRSAILLFQDAYCSWCGTHYNNGESHDVGCKGQIITDSIENIVNDFVRAGGDVECISCGKTYYKHPLDINIKSYSGEPFLHIICGGKRVKL